MRLPLQDLDYSTGDGKNAVKLRPAVHAGMRFCTQERGYFPLNPEGLAVRFAVSVVFEDRAGTYYTALNTGDMEFSQGPKKAFAGILGDDKDFLDLALTMVFVDRYGTPRHVFHPGQTISLKIHQLLALTGEDLDKKASTPNPLIAAYRRPPPACPIHRDTSVGCQIQICHTIA